MKIKFFALTGLLIFSFSGAASAGCRFSWTHYGDKATKELIDQNIGSHVTAKFCSIAKKYDIVVQSNAYTLHGMCAGHSTVSLRKKESNTQQVKNFHAIFTDTNCRTIEYARDLAAEATFGAVDDLMINLTEAVKSEI